MIDDGRGTTAESNWAGHSAVEVSESTNMGTYISRKTCYNERVRENKIWDICCSTRSNTL